MGSRLIKLTIIAIASFVGGLSALTHSLEIRQSQQLATCTYKTSKSRTPNPQKHDYVFSINLPGKAWESVCSEPPVMDWVLQALRYKCHSEWDRKSLHKFLRYIYKAVPQEGQCHLRMTVRVTQPKQDLGFPIFEDDCLWDEKPRFPSCELNPEDFPWPSTCFNAEVVP